MNRLTLKAVVMALLAISGVAFAQTTSENTALYGRSSIWLSYQVRVHSGDVVIQQPSNSTLAFGSELAMSSGASIADNAYADTIYMDWQTSIEGTATYNELDSRGYVGAESTALNNPVITWWTLPPFTEATSGTENIHLNWDQTIVLPPGHYGDLFGLDRVTVVLTGGEYHFENFRVGNDSRVIFEGPSDLLIADKLFLGHRVDFGGTGGVTAADIVVNVSGVNGTTGGQYGSPKAVQLGDDSQVDANMVVPDGTINFGYRVRGEGSFYAKYLKLLQGTNIYLNSAY